MKMFCFSIAVRKWFVNLDSSQASLKSEVVCLQEEMQRLFCPINRCQLQVQGKMLWVDLPHFNHTTQDRYTDANLCPLHAFLDKSWFLLAEKGSSSLPTAVEFHIVSSCINIFVSVQFCWLKSSGVYKFGWVEALKNYCLAKKKK